MGTVHLTQHQNRAWGLWQGVGVPPPAPHSVPTACLPPTPQRSFKNFPSREPMRRMHKQEGKAELSLDRLQLEALHKVRQPPHPAQLPVPPPGCGAPSPPF